MTEPVVELKEDDVFSYEQQFRMAVTAANDYANRRAAHNPDTDPLEKNQLRVKFLTEDLGPNYGGDRIAMLERESQKGLPGYAAAAKALRNLATELSRSTIDKPSTKAPPVKVIKKAPSPS